MNFTHDIYALVDPNTGKDRYVGHTIGHPSCRLHGHISAARCAARRSAGKPLLPKDEWISSLLAKGQEPTFRVIVRIKGCFKAISVEREMIVFLLNCGVDLTNVSCNRARRVGSRWVAVTP